MHAYIHIHTVLLQLYFRWPSCATSCGRRCSAWEGPDELKQCLDAWGSRGSREEIWIGLRDFEQHSFQKVSPSICVRVFMHMCSISATHTWKYMHKPKCARQNRDDNYSWESWGGHAAAKQSLCLCVQYIHYHTQTHTFFHTFAYLHTYTSTHFNTFIHTYTLEKTETMIMHKNFWKEGPRGCCPTSCTEVNSTLPYTCFYVVVCVLYTCVWVREGIVRLCVRR